MSNSNHESPINYATYVSFTLINLSATIMRNLIIGGFLFVLSQSYILCILSVMACMILLIPEILNKINNTFNNIDMNNSVINFIKENRELIFWLTTTIMAIIGISIYAGVGMAIGCVIFTFLSTILLCNTPLMLIIKCDSLPYIDRFALQLASIPVVAALFFVLNILPNPVIWLVSWSELLKIATTVDWDKVLSNVREYMISISSKLLGVNLNWHHNANDTNETDENQTWSLLQT